MKFTNDRYNVLCVDLRTKDIHVMLSTHQTLVIPTGAQVALPMVNLYTCATVVEVTKAMQQFVHQFGFTHAVPMYWDRQEQVLYTFPQPGHDPKDMVVLDTRYKEIMEKLDYGVTHTRRGRYALMTATLVGGNHVTYVAVSNGPVTQQVIVSRTIIPNLWTTSDLEEAKVKAYCLSTKLENNLNQYSRVFIVDLVEGNLYQPNCAPTVGGFKQRPTMSRPSTYRPPSNLLLNQAMIALTMPIIQIKEPEMKQEQYVLCRVINAAEPNDLIAGILTEAGTYNEPRAAGFTNANRVFMCDTHAITIAKTLLEQMEPVCHMLFARHNITTGETTLIGSKTPTGEMRPFEIEQAMTELNNQMLEAYPVPSKKPKGKYIGLATWAVDNNIRINLFGPERALLPIDVITFEDLEIGDSQEDMIELVKSRRNQIRHEHVKCLGFVYSLNDDRLDGPFVLDDDCCVSINEHRVIIQHIEKLVTGLVNDYRDQENEINANKPGRQEDKPDVNGLPTPDEIRAVKAAVPITAEQMWEHAVVLLSDPINIVVNGTKLTHNSEILIKGNQPSKEDIEAFSERCYQYGWMVTARWLRSVNSFGFWLTSVK